MKTAAILLFVAVLTGAVLAQQPTNTPTTNTATQLTNAATVKLQFAAALTNHALLLKLREDANRPNYAGNAYEAVRRQIWKDLAQGKLVLTNTSAP